MATSVGAGEELMPQRNSVNLPNNSQTDSVAEECEAAAAPTTPIRKLSRNRGLVLQEQAVVEDSPESDDAGTRAAVIRKGKRKLRWDARVFPLCLWLADNVGYVFSFPQIQFFLWMFYTVIRICNFVASSGVWNWATSFLFLWFLVYALGFVSLYDPLPFHNFPSVFPLFVTHMAP